MTGMLMIAAVLCSAPCSAEAGELRPVALGTGLELISRHGSGSRPRLLRSGHLEDLDGRKVGRVQPSALDLDLSPAEALIATVHAPLPGVRPALLQLHSWPEAEHRVSMDLSGGPEPVGVRFLDDWTVLVRLEGGQARRFALYSDALPVPLAAGDVEVGHGAWLRSGERVWVVTDRGTLEISAAGEVLHPGPIPEPWSLVVQLPTPIPESKVHPGEPALQRDLAGRLGRGSRPLFTWPWGFRQWDQRTTATLLEYVDRDLDRLEHGWQRGEWSVLFDLRKVEPTLRRAFLYSPHDPRVTAARDRHRRLDAVRDQTLAGLMDLALCAGVAGVLLLRLFALFRACRRREGSRSAGRASETGCSLADLDLSASAY